jgi:hypothetical protein
MRKTAKKLTLNRETLRHLEEGTLPKMIAGAATQIDCSFCVGSCVAPTLRTTCRCTAVAATCTTTA